MINLIINADDYGLNQQCSEAIISAWEKRLITDTTIVANGTYFEEAILKAKSSELARNIGIHFNLTEGIPLSKEIDKIDAFVKNGVFHGEIDRKRRLNNAEEQAVFEELSAQVERLKETGINITHADSHHHIHTALYILPIVIRVCRKYDIEKIRIHRNLGNMSIAKRAGKGLLNYWIRSQGLITTLHFGSMNDIRISHIKGCCEIMVHPDFDGGGILIDRKKKAVNGSEGSPLTLPNEIGEYKLLSYKELR